MISHTVVDSPVGPLTLVADGQALCGLYLSGQRHLPAAVAFGMRDDTVLPAVREQLTAYFARSLEEFDLPLATRGTPFQAHVWQALRAVPYGSTCTYTELAAAVGRPTAVRAVGAANGRNPVCIVVPCHRVVGVDRTLTGYAGGLERKRFLLDLELAGTPPR
ncbi:MAG: methylated-DNA--[protein]-cysteine S-methyltransferase [Actinobacteria bacterium]|nr:methylated-DNA--[protein]-cysteine S-methyltransferase [Actinomycetota bacterium]MBW3646352.1 methylated-DNA--[protein]-cysteine S-methyltransferase [Actinomycetota bacterium]